MKTLALFLFLIGMMVPSVGALAFVVWRENKRGPHGPR